MYAHVTNNVTTRAHAFPGPSHTCEHALGIDGRMAPRYGPQELTDVWHHATGQPKHNEKYINCGGRSRQRQLTS